jgi:hypothetical protein
MNLPRWLPKPGAWASAVALFGYAAVVSIAIAMLMPFIGELMRHSPRLGWLAVLGVWMAPIAGAAVIHHTGHRVLDLGDSARYARGPSSLWAGFVAWATILLVSMTTSFVMLVIDPPPVDPDSVSAFVVQSLEAWHGIVRPIVWIILAAYVYTLERAARRDV